MLDGSSMLSRAHERDHDAELERELAAERAHAVEQVAALARVDEVDEVERDLELERLDAHVGRDAFRRVGRERRRLGLELGLRCVGEDLLVRRQPGREHEEEAADEEERHLRQTGHDRDEADRAAGELERALVARELVQQVGAEVALGRGAGHDQARRQRDEQRGDLRDQARRRR